MIGIVDPARTEANEAITRCRSAGIAVKMITGDHKVTAAAIGEELGIEPEAVEGRELDDLDDDALAEAVERRHRGTRRLLPSLPRQVQT